MFFYNGRKTCVTRQFEIVIVSDISQRTTLYESSSIVDEYRNNVQNVSEDTVFHEELKPAISVTVNLQNDIRVVSP